MAIVYKHIRLDTNEVFYVGIGKDKKRAYSKERNRFWKAVVNKTDYLIEIVEDGLSREEAFAREIELIKHYGRRDLGLGSLVNLTDGGDSIVGFIWTKENKKRISDGLKNHFVSDETKRKQSIAKKGIYGIGDTNVAKRPDVRKKLSEAKKGVPRVKQTCPHCNTIGGAGNMQRWHFDNCKLKI